MGAPGTFISRLINQQVFFGDIHIISNFFAQRKKIGLSRKTRRSIENVKRSNQREADAIKFIRGNFQRRDRRIK